MSNPPGIPNWTAGGMSYEIAIQSQPLSDATNTLILRDTKLTLIAKYLKTHELFKCPSDRSYAIRPVPAGVRFPRARSYSMNGFIGESSRLSDTRLLRFDRWDDFSRLGPSSTFLFLDEHEDSLDDGYFFLGNKDPHLFGWDEVPANHHNRGTHLTFADGHAERRRWKDKRTIFPITRTLLGGVSQLNNPDILWLYQHATAPK
jgi:prepilin-type processing-associated H-X9-DG protein